MNTVDTTHSDDSLWRLDRGDTTLLCAAAAGGMPRVLHYGCRLPGEQCASDWLAATAVGWPFGTLDERANASLLPQASSCFGGYPALQAHLDGQSLDAPLALRAVSQSDAQLCFEYSAEPLRLRVCMALDSSGVAVFHAELENTGERTLQVDWLAAASMELCAAPLELDSFHGRWGQEMQVRRQALSEAGVLLENRRGRSSHQLFPGMVVGEPGFGPARGDCHAMQLAWSGNARLLLQRQFDGSALMQCGVLYQPGEMRLAGGQSLRSPDAVLSHGSGSDALAQRYHRYAREQVLPRWTRSARPVHANSWEAMYFDLDTDKLCQLVDAAVSVGAERFVLDDGWFVGRRDDTAGLGDWRVDEGVFPAGLQPLVDHVRASGLQFGLWFEPEMVNPDSELYRQHPDWVLSHSGVQMPAARQQLVLDIARPEVSEYLYQHIAALVQQYGIDYIKWDMNRDLPAAGDQHVARAAAQPAALYALLQRLNQRFPALEIESCSSGGARCDLGVLAHTGRVWSSDNNDPVERFRIHQAAAQFLPPEVLGAHLGPERAHISGRVTSVHSRAVMAMCGQFGFEVDPRNLSAEETARMRNYAELYKRHRRWLAQAHWHRVSGLWSGLLASAFVAADGSRAMLALMCERNLDSATSGRVCVPGLQADARYRLSVEISDQDSLQRRNRQLPPWLESGLCLPGAVLHKVGLALPVLAAHDALLILLERES